MSLLQEMERHGLAYCEFNNRLLNSESKGNTKYFLFVATYQLMQYNLILQKERAIK